MTQFVSTNRKKTFPDVNSLPLIARFVVAGSARSRAWSSHYIPSVVVRISDLTRVSPGVALITVRGVFTTPCSNTDAAHTRIPAVSYQVLSALKKINANIYRKFVPGTSNRRQLLETWPILSASQCYSISICGYQQFWRTTPIWRY